MANKWVTSPTVEQVADTPLELSEGLLNDSGKLIVDGADGGFIDEFEGSILDASLWECSAGVTVSNGKIIIESDADRGWNTHTRYISSKLLTDPHYTPTIYHGYDTDKIIIKFTKIANVNDLFFMAYSGYGRETDTANAAPGIGFYVNMYTDGRLVLTQAPNNKIITTIPNFNIGDSACLIFKCIRGTEPDEYGYYHYLQLGYSLDDMATVIMTPAAGISYGYLGISGFGKNAPIQIDYFKLLGYPTEATATLPESEAYSVQAPAKLASLDSVLVNRSTLGNGGEARLYMQYKDDEFPEWKSFEGVVGDWSDIGLIDGTELPITNCKPLTNGMVRCKIVFTGNGLVSYPTIDKITYNWSSDVTAPSEPTITTAIATSESILTMLFADLPADAYAIIYEVDINGAGSLPFSTRGKIESGYGYMRFVGSKTEVQKEAEINSLLHSIKGLREGDVVVITAFARDKVGNISAGKQKAITMSGVQYKTMLTKVISESVKTTVVTDSLKEV